MRREADYGSMSAIADAHFRRKSRKRGDEAPANRNLSGCRDSARPEGSDLTPFDDVMESALEPKQVYVDLRQIFPVLERRPIGYLNLEMQRHFAPAFNPNMSTLIVLSCSCSKVHGRLQDKTQDNIQVHHRCKLQLVALRWLETVLFRSKTIHLPSFLSRKSQSLKDVRWSI
jgi:hypothetical protein